jgi:hypothetical protein
MGKLKKIARYKHPSGMEGLVPSKWDKNGKPIEWREADPEGWYRKLAIKGKKKKSKKA